MYASNRATAMRERLRRTPSTDEALPTSKLKPTIWTLWPSRRRGRRIRCTTDGHTRWIDRASTPKRQTTTRMRAAVPRAAQSDDESCSAADGPLFVLFSSPRRKIRSAPSRRLGSKNTRRSRCHLPFTHRRGEVIKREQTTKECYTESLVLAAGHLPVFSCLCVRAPFPRCLSPRSTTSRYKFNSAD